MQTLMKLSLDYIEQNLKTDITAEELADIAGYSVWHYYKLFNEITGSSVLAYILKRRLDHAIAEIAEGRKAIDVTFDYGFNTYAGFYKAFVKMYGVSPKKYLSIYGEHKSKNSGGYYMINNRKEFTEGELRRVLKNWDIPQDLPLKSRAVRMNDGNRLTDREWNVGDNYMLATADERSSILKDLWIYKGLYANQLEMKPVKTKSNDEYLDGANIFILIKKAVGEPLINRIEQFKGKEQELGYKYGQAIAKIHRALLGIESNVMPDNGNIYEYTVPYISDMRAANEEYNLGIPDKFFDDYTETFGKLFDELPKQLIGGNMHPGNIIFNGDDAISFEFNNGGYGNCRESDIRLFDICYCAENILRELMKKSDDNINEKWLEILSGMMRGYDSINKLTTEEKQAVYYVICSVKLFYYSFIAGTAWGENMTNWDKTTYDNLWFIVENKKNIDNIF